MHEILRADEWIYGKLAAWAPLTALVGTRIHRDVAPAKTTAPYVTFSPIPQRDTVIVGGERVKSDLLYAIKVVGTDANANAMATAADIIDSLFDQAAGTTTDSRILASNREYGLSYSEVSEGVIWRHEGGVYRVQIQDL